MAQSIQDKIADAAKAALLAVPQITGVDGRVERNREDAYTREEGSGINLRSVSDPLRPISDEIDDCEYTLSADIYVFGADWEKQADAIAVEVEKRLRDYTYTGIKLTHLRRLGGEWDGDGVDNTPGKREVQFAYRFLVFSMDMTKQP